MFTPVSKRLAVLFIIIFLVSGCSSKQIEPETNTGSADSERKTRGIGTAISPEKVQSESEEGIKTRGQMELPDLSSDDWLRPLDVRLPEADDPEYVYVEAKNNSNEPIRLALSYQYKGSWWTQGFWKLDPGEQALIARTDNLFVYFHAHDKYSREWGGSYTFKVDDHIGRYSFFEKLIDTGVGKYVQSFD